MKAYEVVGKFGRPRYQTNPIAVATEEDVEEDDDIAYTPIDDRDKDRISAMSRMSISRLDTV
jgi:hypothetical protein